MRWDEFEAACPEIATLARERFAADQLVLVGTIRADGSPRISPNEVDLAAERLLLGMMWRSRKALDLLRDPRVVVHSVPTDRFNTGGDVKLYGRVVDEQDPGVRRAFREEIRRRIDWAPDEPEYHLFSLDVSAAGYTVFGEGSHALAWDPARSLRRLALR
ncbi:MAG TPA: pyridoxamine 5'-phosphate oxidase family protein [Actinomycetota bacterium]|nr:pyridoxamine 5'-phosphate oxidase family protein [Actinomycetota bacterium]